MIAGAEVDVKADIYTGRALVQHYHGDACIVVQPLGKKGTPVVVARHELKEIVQVVQVRHRVVRKNPWPFVVGLAGPKKVGKSTTAEALDIALKRYFNQIDMKTASFAGPLYEAVSVIVGVPVHILKDQRVKDRKLTEAETSNPCVIGKTPREILEWQGEGVRQFFGVDHWVHRAFNPLPLEGNGRFGIVVFDDARHGPEFEATDINFELAAAGRSYPCNHPSAMPPDPKYIAEKITRDEMTPREVGERLAVLIVDAMKAKGLTWS